MNYDKDNTVTPRDNDDPINLVEILMQLWRGRLLIVVIAILAIFTSSLYLYVAKEKWTSESIVTLPDSGQIASYSNTMTVLYLQDPNSTPSVLDIQKTFFSRFNTAISALSEQLANKAIPESLNITSFLKDQAVPVKISYTAANAADAQKRLTSFLQEINSNSIKELNNDLKVNINSKINSLKEQLNSKEKIAQEKKEQRLQVLNQALVVAQQSNIKTPIVQQAETLSDDTLFMLGSEALSSTIKNESTRPLPFDNSYYNVHQLLLSVNGLLSEPQATDTIRYILKPSLPIRRDSPKKGIVLIFGALIGFVLGSACVIGRNALKDNLSTK